MADIRTELKTINKMRGHPESHIDVEGDGCYNNPLYSGIGKTPFQPATQSCYVVVENMTDKKLVINLVTKNKLCSHGKDHSNENINKKNCKCTQNLQMVESIGNEQRSASESLSKLYSEGFEVRHITTDPDSSAYRAAEQLASNYNSKVTPEHLIDTRHFSDNHRKQIKKNEILTSLMPARTKKQREDLIGRFALDLSQRCHAEYKSALKHCDGNFQTFKRKLSHTVDAIILCYQSKHCICKRNSFVCKGIEDPWINKSIYLPKTFKLNLTLKQQSELRKCINYRLGPKELERTKLGTNTQKSECVNRIIRRSLPRSNTFSKNFQGRANSAVSSANHGPGVDWDRKAQERKGGVAPAYSKKKAAIFLACMCSGILQTQYERFKAYDHNGGTKVIIIIEHDGSKKKTNSVRPPLEDKSKLRILYEDSDDERDEYCDDPADAT
ncbi:unnamed protein product [Mytilus edulis]|uniref:Mutator-like transposase domain-containing protein n=1 Tax=Mytilus edulis TaxID=6550 RepID=A0A8S3R9M6_MYTED|nr:unnamed protein product [Mytilus edulis]